MILRPGLLQQRLNTIQNRWGQPADLAAVSTTINLEDAKKKYLKKE